MAFANRNNSAAAADRADQSWKNDAWVNLYVPSADGTGRKKLGAIGLKLSRGFDAAVINRLNQGPEAVQALLQNLEIEYVLVDETKEVSVGF